MTQTSEVAAENMEIVEVDIEDLFESFEMDIRSNDTYSLTKRVLTSEARKEMHRIGEEIVPLIERRIAELKAMPAAELEVEVIEAWEMALEWMT
jgi:hypothetical protein